MQLGKTRADPCAATHAECDDGDTDPPVLTWRPSSDKAVNDQAEHAR